jgi:hypothetical protein
LQSYEDRFGVQAHCRSRALPAGGVRTVPVCREASAHDTVIARLTFALMEPTITTVVSDMAQQPAPCSYTLTITQGQAVSSFNMMELPPHQKGDKQGLLRYETRLMACVMVKGTVSVRFDPLRIAP